MAYLYNWSLKNAFKGETCARGFGYRHANVTQAPLKFNPKKISLEIPINKDVFEVPVFALEDFVDTIVSENKKPDVLVAALETSMRVAGYASLTRYMQDMLVTSFNDNRLILCEVKMPDKSAVNYYTTCGAAFTKDFKPVFMLSWVVRRIRDNEGKYKYDFVRPIFRMSVDCYLDKETPMEKFVLSKLSTAVLEDFYEVPLFYTTKLSPRFTCYNAGQPTYKKATVEIGEFPFTFKKADTPSISTTRDALIKTALDYIDEVIIWQ